MANFTEALQFVLKEEGGYVNDPRDSGGATDEGITQRVYDQYRSGKSLPTQTVRLISDVEVEEIYEDQYFDAAHCEEMPDDIGTAVFDTAVNCGVGRAVKLLQAILDVTADGVFGQATKAALSEQTVSDADIGFLVDRYLDRRITFYNNLVTQKPEKKAFLKGWLNRVEELRNLLIN